jgi:hypothetical protein
VYVCNLEFIFTVFFIGSICDDVEEDAEDTVDWEYLLSRFITSQQLYGIELVNFFYRNNSKSHQCCPYSVRPNKSFDCCEREKIIKL